MRQTERVTWNGQKLPTAPAHASESCVPLPALLPLSSERAHLNRLDAMRQRLNGKKRNHCWSSSANMIADELSLDCMTITESIPLPDLHYLPSPKEDGNIGIRVSVCEVYSPSHFWLIDHGSSHICPLDSLMEVMRQYYDKGVGRNRWLLLNEVRVGQYCSCEYDGVWHRAVIIRILDSKTVKVRYVDYGTVSTVSSVRLKPLLRQFSLLPAQAIRARLACVKPKTERWTLEASAALMNWIEERPMQMAYIAGIDYKERVLEVHLEYRLTGEFANCDLWLRGLAEFRFDSTLFATDIYLQPKYEALENGFSTDQDEGAE